MVAHALISVSRVALRRMGIISCMFKLSFRGQQSALLDDRTFSQRRVRGRTTTAPAATSREIGTPRIWQRVMYKAVAMRHMFGLP